MGDVGIEEEFDLKGINYLGGPKDGEHKVELKAGYAMPHDPDVMLRFPAPILKSQYRRQHLACRGTLHCNRVIAAAC